MMDDTQGFDDGGVFEADGGWEGQEAIFGYHDDLPEAAEACGSAYVAELGAAVGEVGGAGEAGRWR